jgi:hypothetical protein
MLHEEVEQSRLRKLRQMLQDLVGYQMESAPTGS